MGENSLKEYLQISDEFDRLDKQKLIIAAVIHQKMKDRGLSINELARNIEGISVSQISRVLHGENYRIMTLLTILNYLGLELDLEERTEH